MINYLKYSDFIHYTTNLPNTMTIQELFQLLCLMNDVPRENMHIEFQNGEVLKLEWNRHIGSPSKDIVCSPKMRAFHLKLSIFLLRIRIFSSGNVDFSSGNTDFHTKMIFWPGQKGCEILFILAI